MLSTAHHPGWDTEDCLVPKAYGAAWQQSKRSLLLIVPGVVVRMERNVLINDSHPEVQRIMHSLHQPIWWDQRLFSAPAAPPAAATVRQRRPKP